MTKVKTHTKTAALELMKDPERFAAYGSVVATGVGPIENEYGVIAVFDGTHKSLPARIDGVLVYAMSCKLD